MVIENWFVSDHSNIRLALATCAYTGIPGAVIILSNTAAQVDEAAKSLRIGEHAWVSSP